MAGTIRNGAGEPPSAAPSGTLHLSSDGAARLSQGDRWCPVEAGPMAGYRLSDDFDQASGGTLVAPLATQDTSAAGSPTLDFADDAAGGHFVLKLDVTNEVEAVTLYAGDQLTIDPTKGPILSMRLKIEPDVTGAGGDLAAGDIIVFGLASARDATLDDVTTHAWFRLEGANKNILIEADDGTTDTDDVDSGVDWVADTFIDVQIDMSSLSAVGFYVNGVRRGQASIPAATGLLQPFVEVTKAAATNFDHRVTVDFIDVYQPSR